MKIFDREWYYRKFIKIATFVLSEEKLKNIKSKHQVRLSYEYTFHRPLHLCYPRTLNEKLIWLSMYWKHPLIVQCADKYKMREYVESCGLSHILVPLLGVWSDSKDIDWNKLPKSFVLKCNHGCGYNIIVRDKEKINLTECSEQLQNWLETTYKGSVAENHYERIQPHVILAEKFLLPSSSAKLLKDYKLFCFNGEPRFVDLCYDRDDEFEATHAEFTLDWKQFEGKPIDAAKPSSLEKMIEYARILAKPFPFVRADFYEVDGKLYIGELTFSPWGNFITEFSEETQNKYGKMLHLPKKMK